MSEDTLRILLWGYLPPPYFGQSVTYQALMRSEFPQRFSVTFLDITVVDDIQDLGVFQMRKLWRLLGFLVRETWLLATQRFDFLCEPISANRNAFLKDALLLGLARLFGVRTVLYAHGNNVPDFHSRSPAWMKKVIDHTIRNAAGAIVLGETLRYNFEPWLHPECIFVAQPGIEPAPARPAPTDHRKLVTVLYLGNLIREKGVFVLLEAAGLIARQRSDLRFVFAGSWYRREDEREARDLVLRYGLEKAVSFLGPVAGESKYRALHSADLLAFPTFYYHETVGLVLLEAMQAGLPVVTTRRASIPEVVIDGVHGLLVEERNPQDLADKILRLAADSDLRKRMGAEGRQRFESHYTHLHYGRRMIETFEALSRLDCQRS